MNNSIDEIEKKIRETSRECESIFENIKSLRERISKHQSELTSKMQKFCELTQELKEAYKNVTTAN